MKENKDPTLCDCICHKQKGVMHFMACCVECPDCKELISVDHFKTIDGLNYIDYHKKHHCNKNKSK